MPEVRTIGIHLSGSSQIVKWLELFHCLARAKYFASHYVRSKLEKLFQFDIKHAEDDLIHNGIKILGSYEIVE